MNTLNFKPVTTIATVCAASLLLSATALAAGGGRMGGASTSNAVHTSAPVRATSAQPAPTTAHTTGQPNQTCGSASAPNTPGNAAMAPGSAFNPDGKAGTMYAGQQPQNSKNPTSVSQYDVACSHQH